MGAHEVSEKPYTDHELHDLKAATSDFFMLMSSIESTIESIFVSELSLSERTSEIILPRIQSVATRWKMVRQSCAVRGDPEEFRNLLEDLEARHVRLRQSRNQYAHALSLNEKRNCLSTRDRKGQEEALTGPTILKQLEEARELFHNFTLLLYDLDTIQLIGEPNNPRVSVIRAALEAREGAAVAG
jgi:hypothetical protein